MKIEAGMCAYVSGAGSGIGRGIALALARRGVRVGVCDIKLGDAQDTVRQIEALGGSALAVQVDVSDSASVEQAVAAIEQAYGAIANRGRMVPPHVVKKVGDKVLSHPRGQQIISPARCQFR